MGKELIACQSFESPWNDYAVIAATVCDENGDLTHTVDNEGFAYMHELDHALVAWLCGECVDHVKCNEDAVKN